jgi:hypothetical protein
VTEGLPFYTSVRRGRGGGGVWSGAVPHGEEVGEGPDPIGKQRAAGNDPAMMLVGGAQCMWSVPKQGSGGC